MIAATSFASGKIPFYFFTPGTIVRFSSLIGKDTVHEVAGMCRNAPNSYLVELKDELCPAINDGVSLRTINICHAEEILKHGETGSVEWLNAAKEPNSQQAFKQQLSGVFSEKGSVKIPVSRAFNGYNYRTGEVCWKNEPGDLWPLECWLTRETTYENSLLSRLLRSSSVQEMVDFAKLAKALLKSNACSLESDSKDSGKILVVLNRKKLKKFLVKRLNSMKANLAREQAVYDDIMNEMCEREERFYSQDD